MRKGYTHITIVLDSSGSMNTIKKATIEGYNAFVQENNKLPGELSTMVTQFNHDVKVGPLTVANLNQLNEANYHPMGSTALYDAIGDTINFTGKALEDMPEDRRPERVIFVIVTDGEENASREFNRDQIFKMIGIQREIYKWEFVFMGANQDAYAVAEQMNISVDSALNYGHTSHETRAAWKGMTVNTMSYRTGLASSLSFSEDQRAEAQQDSAA
jgi:hypothetical protein